MSLPHHVDDPTFLDRDDGVPVFATWAEPAGQVIEVAPRAWQVCADVVNVAAIETDEGLVLIDAGMRRDGEELRRLVRTVTDAPLHTVVFTHGHIDHAFGLEPFLSEACTRRPRIVAHRAIVERFRRYARTSDHNATLNGRQFHGRRPWWPRDAGDFFWPDTVYDTSLTLRIGGDELRLHHAKGETDDGTWVWVPSRGLVCVGDLWLGVAPNAGNPQKVQRYAEEWADAAEEIAALGADVMVPGHAMPVVGSDEIRSSLLDMAAFLRHIAAHVVDGLNAGLRPDEIVSTLEIPPDLAGKPYLQPFHDRPEFIARNVIRRYGGWWNGYAADLLPAPRADLARELVVLAGGANHVAERVRELLADDLPLACQLAELAALGDPACREAQACVVDAFERRSKEETSFMARGIYRAAIAEAREALGER